MTKRRLDLTAHLALALEVPESEILGFQYYPSGYSVILKDYRKFVDVQPATDEELAAATTEAGPGYPDGLPEELHPVWDDPRNQKVQPLRELASFLGVRDARALRKAGLVTEILALKEQPQTAATDRHLRMPTHPSRLKHSH